MAILMEGSLLALDTVPHVSPLSSVYLLLLSCLLTTYVLIHLLTYRIGGQCTTVGELDVAL